MTQFHLPWICYTKVVILIIINSILKDAGTVTETVTVLSTISSMIQNNETDGINDTDNIIKTHELPDATLNLWVILFIVAMFFTVTCYAYLYCWQMDYYQRHRPPVAQQQLIVALDRRRENEEIEETAV